MEAEQNETSSFYTAAVLEFNAPGDKLSKPLDIVEANLAEYLNWIDEAQKNGVDILVFPEATLNYNGKSFIKLGTIRHIENDARKSKAIIYESFSFFVVLAGISTFMILIQSITNRKSLISLFRHQLAREFVAGRSRAGNGNFRHFRL